MAPARIEDDPVTAEYDIFLTPAIQEQIFLLQYPNRNRDRPYNARFGVRPDEMRIKPNSGYLELDVNLSTEHNFNKFQGLKWGDAMRTARELQNDSATYGIASGFSGPKATISRRTGLKDAVEREHDMQNDLQTFADADSESKVLHTQTLGGQIIRHDSADELGKPLYFVGAFRGRQLHLTKITGTIQMRPQFHHVDAEDQRGRLAGSREFAASAAGTLDGAATSSSGATQTNPEQYKMVQQLYKSTSNPKGELELREKEMGAALKAAYEEKWMPLEYVDEDDEDAYAMWNERMFIKDAEGCARLQSGMSNEEYLDAISAPGRQSPTRRRKRVSRKKEVVEVEDETMEETDEG